MRIRTMAESDIMQVAEIEKESFSQPWSAHAFEESMNDGNAVFLVAEDSCEEETPDIVGYIGMYVSAPEGEITNVAVSEKVRGKGFGKSLVLAMQEKAEALGVQTIFLEVRESNAPAIHVYAQMGFEEIGKRKGFYDFPREDARVMRWQSNEMNG